MSYSPKLGSAFNKTRLRDPEHPTTCSGMCSVCGECPGLCEIGLAAVRLSLIHIFQAIIGDQDYMLDEMAKGNFAVEPRVPERYVGDFTAVLNSLTNIKSRLDVYKRQPIPRPSSRTPIPIPWRSPTPPVRSS